MPGPARHLLFVRAKDQSRSFVSLRMTSRMNLKEALQTTS